MHRLLSSFILFYFSFALQAQINTDLLKHKLDSVLVGVNENEPGGSIYIEQGNQTVYSRSFGLADVKSKEKFTDFTVSNIGGISKTFIAYSILILQKQGKLSIEDPINKYFPDLINKEIASKVTIKHLLMHTSGFIDGPLLKKDSISYLKITDKQNFEAFKKITKLAFEPGSNYAYSDQAYSGLVLIIEQLSKLKFHEFVTQSILAASGMTFTKITDGVFPSGKVAHAYLRSNKNFKEYDNGECPKMETVSSAGVWSNIVDLRKYLYALKYNLFLDSATLKLSEQYITPSSGNSTYSHGLCWFGNDPKNKDHDVFIEYAASQCAFRSHIIYFPEKDLTIIWLSNSNVDHTSKITKQLIALNFIK